MTETASQPRFFLICCGSTNKLVSVTDVITLAEEARKHCSSEEVPLSAVVRAWDVGRYVSPDGRVSVDAR